VKDLIFRKHHLIIHASQDSKAGIRWEILQRCACGDVEAARDRMSQFVRTNPDSSAFLIRVIQDLRHYNFIKEAEVIALCSDSCFPRSKELIDFMRRIAESNTSLTFASDERVFLVIHPTFKKHLQIIHASQVSKSCVRWETLQRDALRCKQNRVVITAAVSAAAAAAATAAGKSAPLVFTCSRRTAGLVREGLGAHSGDDQHVLRYEGGSDGAAEARQPLRGPLPRKHAGVKKLSSTLSLSRPRNQRFLLRPPPCRRFPRRPPRRLPYSLFLHSPSSSSIVSLSKSCGGSSLIIVVGALAGFSDRTLPEVLIQSVCRGQSFSTSWWEANDALAEADILIFTNLAGISIVRNLLHWLLKHKASLT